MIEIPFEILRDACKYTGKHDWKDGENCNRSEFSYEGELEGYGDDAGYLIRSDQPCSQEVCPFLKES